MFVQRLPQNGTGLTLFDPNANSKAIKVKKQDWNEVQIKAISEILMAMKVYFFYFYKNLSNNDQYIITYLYI